MKYSRDFTGNLHGNTRFFTGREYDGEIWLYYLRARYYDPVNGRFVSRDPIGQVDDVNLYGYVGNSPMMFVDLMGTEKKALMKKADATSLFLADLNDGKTSITDAWFSKFYYANETSCFDCKFNTKNREDYLKIAIDPITGKQDCTKSSISENATPGGCFVYIDKQKVELSELGNFLVGYNGYWAGMSLNDSKGLLSNPTNDVYKAGLTIEEVNRDNYFVWKQNSSLSKDALNDELRDRPWYNAGYSMATTQDKGERKANLRGFMQGANK